MSKSQASPKPSQHKTVAVKPASVAVKLPSGRPLPQANPTQPFSKGL